MKTLLAGPNKAVAGSKQGQPRCDSHDRRGRSLWSPRFRCCLGLAPHAPRSTRRGHHRGPPARSSALTRQSSQVAVGREHQLATGSSVATEEGLPDLEASQSQLEDKFKHAGDFVVTATRGAAGVQAYEKAL